ncbi:hypothetical protein [Microbulbifer variabilis]|uniref:hypothetical protein n=1 Tax=Microbulbifer variabilis TaxID=266805 RepID=UPI001CFCACDC|nr:hypothetical protein [Microbulbifer variabilis]
MYKVLIPIVLLAMISTATAQPRKPPQEAYDACNGMAENDDCTVETKQQETLEGTCLMPPKEERLVCVPEKMKGRGPGRDKKEDTE